MRYSASAYTRFYHRFRALRVTKYRYQALQGPMRERILCVSLNRPFFIQNPLIYQAKKILLSNAAN
jgi:hypothetical protein